MINNKITRKNISLSLLSCFGLAMVACSDSGYVAPPAEDASTLTLSITDAPLDGVAKVYLQIRGIEIKPENGSVKTIDFDAPIDLDVLSLNAGKRMAILVNEDLTAGNYDYIRLLVNAEEGEPNSKVLLTDNTWQSLYIPGESKADLKIEQSFNIDRRRNTHLTIDIDLKKSLTKENNEDGYQFTPSLRMVEEYKYAHIKGFIANDLLDSGAGCIDRSGDEPQAVGAVYIYTELAEGSEPQDIQRTGSDPLASASIDYDEVRGEFHYTLGYIPVDATYSVALVCDAGLDNPAAVDELEFLGEPQVVTVDSDETMDLDFNSLL